LLTRCCGIAETTTHRKAEAVPQKLKLSLTQFEYKGRLQYVQCTQYLRTPSVDVLTVVERAAVRLSGLQCATDRSCMMQIKQT
jgi:hypothetical protein